MKKFFGIMAICISVLSTGYAGAAGFGVCTHMCHGNSYNNALNIQSAKDVKASWIRDGATWSSMQPNGANTEIKLSDKDADYLKKAEKGGINQLLVLAYGNKNYNGVTDNMTLPTANDTVYYNGWLEYVEYTVTQVKDYVDAYEVWNEPNIDVFNYNLAASGEDYAKLYLDTKAIINKIDPTARVLCGAITGAAEKYAEDILKYVSEKGNVNDLIDVFSIHIYTQLDDELYASALEKWETLFDKYGFTGDVWMTENGVTADGSSSRTETAQAAMVAKLGTHWENFLMKNNRNGVNFWYDLRNDVGVSDYEDNFGLVDSSHNMKPSGYAAKIYNRLTCDKTLTEYSETGVSRTAAVAKYSNNKSTVYVGYRSSTGASANVTIPLSGDVAYVYDYLGNLTETINNPSGTKTLSVDYYPKYVECVTYEAEISELNYDAEKNILAVSGKYDFGTSAELEIVNDKGATVQTKKVIPDGDGKFETWFSLDNEGNFTLYLARREMTNLGRTDYPTKTFTAEKSIPNGEKIRTVASGTVITYNANTKKAAVSGTVTNFSDTDHATVLVVPKTPFTTEKLTTLPTSEMAYIGQTKLQNGKFSFSFTMPDDAIGEYAVYIGGTKTESLQENAMNAGAVPKYVYVSSFAASETNGKAIATAKLKNLNSEPKSATIIIAQYEANNKLVTVDSKQYTVPAYTTAATEFSYPVDIDASATNVYAFIVEGCNSIMPLAPKATVK